MKAFGDILMVNDPSGGKKVTLQAPSDTVNVHLKPGKIATFQDNRDQSKKTTTDMTNFKKIQFIVNRDSEGHAEIRSFFDDGVSLS